MIKYDLKHKAYDDNSYMINNIRHMIIINDQQHKACDDNIALLQMCRQQLTSMPIIHFQKVLTSNAKPSISLVLLSHPMMSGVIAQATHTSNWKHFQQLVFTV